MAHRLMKEDGQEVAMLPKAGTTPKKKEAAKSAMAPVNEGIAWVASNQFPSDQRPGTSRDNPVHLSDTTDASASGSHPRKDDDFDDEAKLLGHFSDALREMAASIVDLEDGYFRALHEVIVETRVGITGHVPHRRSLCQSGHNGHVLLAGGGTDRCKPHGGC